MVKVLNQPNVRTHFAEADKEVVGNSPAEFKTFIAADAERLPGSESYALKPGVEVRPLPLARERLLAARDRRLPRAES